MNHGVIPGSDYFNAERYTKFIMSLFPVTNKRIFAINILHWAKNGFYFTQGEVVAQLGIDDTMRKHNKTSVKKISEEIMAYILAGRLNPEQTEHSTIVDLSIVADNYLKILRSISCRKG